jgi:hypothetical protein
MTLINTDCFIHVFASLSVIVRVRPWLIFFRVFRVFRGQVK